MADNKEAAWQGENFGYAVKALAKRIDPDRPALVHGGRICDWATFDRHTNSIAAALLESGLKPGDIAGQMQRNSPEYLLAFFGCAKAGITPLNVNYRYQQGELSDIFERFGIKALFVDDEFAETAALAMPADALDPIHAQHGNEQWEEFCNRAPDDGFEPCRDPQALFLMATGGTTGMPKAVMWPASEFWQAQSISSWATSPTEEPFIAGNLAQHLEMAAQIGPADSRSQAPLLLLCPLMHGTAQYTSIGHLLRGGTVITLPGARFDANLAIDTINDRKVRTLVLVGDAHAIPLLDALESRKDAREALASLRLIGSSGALFSEDLKQRLIAINPALIISDVLGSSESGGGTAVRITTKEGTSGGGDFTPPPGRDVALVDENLRLIAPGSAGVGIVARSGPLPLGYLGEEAKNAETFPVIDGKRYLLTGDRARWGEDGALEFIGRDNMCINTGGEKVFPEEVETVLARHPQVHDARVVSLPDPRFGRRIVAVVQPQGAEAEMAEALDQFVRAELADFKIPRQYFFTEKALRLNNGKPDYPLAQAIAEGAA